MTQSIRCLLPRNSFPSSLSVFYFVCLPKQGSHNEGRLCDSLGSHACPCLVLSMIYNSVFICAIFRCYLCCTILNAKCHGSFIPEYRKGTMRPLSLMTVGLGGTKESVKSWQKSVSTPITSLFNSLSFFFPSLSSFLTPTSLLSLPPPFLPAVIVHSYMLYVLERMCMDVCLSQCSVAVKKHRDQGHFYKGKPVIGACFQLQWFSPSSSW